MSAPQCQRVMLIACGSFNPPTIMHLRMFELARDHLRKVRPSWTVVGGVISPTHDSYKKKSLIHSKHRLEMARRAVQSNEWINVSDWETKQSEWTRTRRVLEKYTSLIKDSAPIEWLPNPGSVEQGPVSVKLLCGADLLESFSVPGLWEPEDITAIVKNHGIIVITRENSNPEKYIENSELLSQLADNIHIVTDWICNDVSSTKIRCAVNRGDSIRYLVPDPAIQYINENNLYTSP